MKVVACNSNRPLAEAIAAYMNIELTNASIRRFSDLEIFVEIQENVRGEDVFVVQSTSFPANDNLMELLIALDALRRGSARRITAVMRATLVCTLGGRPEPIPDALRALMDQHRLQPAAGA